jgi:predicted DNA-binding transcriptional regulator YafY
MPLGLAQQGPRLYLVCRYKGYDNERSLALHRMHSVRMSTLTFERPKDFDLKRFDDDGRFGFGEGEKIRLTFRIDKDYGLHLLETPLSRDQQAVERDDGTLEITATVVDSAMLDWWLRGFGEAVCDVRKEKVEA